MNLVYAFFNRLFQPQPPTAEQLEEKKEKRVRNLLLAMISLDQHNVEFPDPKQIYDELRRREHDMNAKDLLDTISESVRAGFMQKIGETDPYYVLSPNGRNHIGLPGSKYC